VGIPSAPGSGGTTIGLKLTANSLAGNPATANGLSVSPIGFSVTGDFRMTFEMWENYTGPAPAGGSGSTQLTGGGWGTSGTKAQYMNSTQTSLWFAQTGDGGNSTTSQDYHAFSSAGTSATIGYNAASGVFAAGTDLTAIDNANAHYAALGGNPIPAAQTTLFPAQTGSSAAGAPGFSWQKVTIEKDGNTVTYTIGTTLIATIDNVNSLTLDGSDIELNQSDINGGPSTSPNLVFGVIDNLQVVVPEPSTYALLGAGIAGLFFMRRRVK
jgi:hypothetical protein